MPQAPIDFDRRDTLVLKALGISAIVFHNFFHVVSPVHQDEFTFAGARFWVLLKELSTPVRGIEGLLTFYGHFGAELFVFLSAYGLARSHWDDLSSWGSFLRGRIKKLYPVFGLVVLIWFILIASEFGLLFTLKIYGARLLWMFAGVSNLIPGYGLPPVGPWWFIPFIVQFYALWPFLRRLTNRFGPRGLFVLSVACLISVYIFNWPLAHWSISLLSMPIGHMPELCLGIAAARFPLRIRLRVVILAAAALILGGMYRWIWPLTYSSALILSLALYPLLRNRLRKSQLLARIGEYSVLIFLLNAMVRNVFIPYAKSPDAALLFGCISAVTTFVLAIGIKFLMPQSASGDGEFAFLKPGSDASTP